MDGANITSVDCSTRTLFKYFFSLSRSWTSYSPFERAKAVLETESCKISEVARNDRKEYRVLHKVLGINSIFNLTDNKFLQRRYYYTLYGESSSSKSSLPASICRFLYSYQNISNALRVSLAFVPRSHPIELTSDINAQ